MILYTKDRQKMIKKSQKKKIDKKKKKKSGQKQQMIQQKQAVDGDGDWFILILIGNALIMWFI